VLLAAKFGVPLCPFAALTGVPCPGCGLSRAALALLSGDVAAAFHFHPLVFVALPVLVFVTTTRRERLSVFAGLALGAMMVAVWIARFEGALGGPVRLEQRGLTSR
jgi:hypothetical protein